MANRASVIKFACKNAEELDINNIYVDSSWFFSKYYAIRLKNYENNRKFGISRIVYQIRLKFTDLVDMPKTYDYLKQCLKDIFTIVQHNKFTEFYGNGVRVVITAPSLRENINLPYRSFDEVEIEKTLNEIERVSQSNSGLFYDDLLTFHFVTTKQKN